MVASAIGALVAVGSSVYQGEQSNRRQRRSLRAQERAQSTAAGAARRQERRAADSERRANRQRPDLEQIFAQAASGALPGGLQTMLTGVRGVDPGNLLLGGRDTTLG